jgi:proline racemase
MEGPMRFADELELLLVHCQGEIGKVIVGGAPAIPGATALEKMVHINTVDDSLRRFVTFEPRAGVAMSTNLLVEPSMPEADAGFIVLQPDRAHAMSGSNCICVVTALIESGRIVATEPETVVRLETPAGLIVARARVEGGRCLSVSLDNVPSFVEALDLQLATPWGDIAVDLAFGGVFYALVDVGQIGFEIRPEDARELAVAGTTIKTLLDDQVKVRHPTVSGSDQIAYVMFRDRDADGAIRTCTTLKPGRVDRSPCGTGSSANLAVLHARGEIAIGDERVSRSITGGEFRARAIAETLVGDKAAIIPRISGGAWVYGREFLRMDRDDPFQKGFALSDTWGPHVAELL